MKKFILLLLLFSVKNITSQNGWASFSVSAPNGTITNQETAIYVDNAGNKWIGYGSGIANSAVIARYDNTNTWTFWGRTDLGITTSTVPSYVKDFAEDNVGNLWIATLGGLIKFDGVSFIRYTTANGLPNDRINCLEFKNNMLYIGTNDGLCRWDGSVFTSYNMGNSLFPTNLVADLKVENPNTLWIASGIFLVKFNINSTYTSSSFTTYTTSPTTSLFTIYIDALGDKWINSAMGIVKYSSSGFQYFNNLYPNFTGAGINPGCNFTKGPNNGVLTSAGSGAQSCLVEFLQSGNYKIYYPPSNKKLTSFVASDPLGIIYITGTTTSTPSYVSEMHSFDYSKYSKYKAFGLGEGGGVNSDNFKFLDINQVKAGIMNRGDMWWDIGYSGNAYYEVPKVADHSYAANTGFAASLWIGGLDASNQLHTAAQTYRQSGNDFWPGPLDTTNASIDTIAAVDYDKIWKVSTDDINTFLYQFSLGNVPLTYTPTPDILNWPAKGAGNKSRNLAPYVDVNNNGTYDPLVGGDYPKIKGDQTLYFIFNDNFQSHSQTGGLPFGVEVHAMAYAYGCPSVLNGRTELAYTTFYDYNIINRSNNNYHDVHVAFWADIDLGNWNDDYIGCSVENNLGFCYNADGYDESTAGAPAYIAFPPAVGTTVLKGPIAPLNDMIDNDNDSIVDEVGEECLMNVFNYFNSSGQFPTTQATNKYQFHNYLNGRWKDSSNFTCGGNAYGGTIPTKFVYPSNNYLGNPCTPGWDEFTAGNLAGDRRYLLSSGPFNLPSKSKIEIEYAQVWSVDSFATSNVNLASVNKLISDTRKVRNFYKSGGTSCVGKAIGIKENEINDGLLIYPNPANSVLNIRSENYLGRSTILITDILGKTIIETKNNDLYNTSINIEQLSSGVYLLQLRSEKGLMVKKFIKE